MTVMPSMVIALWSEGPAPPRRLSWPTFGSTRRTPQDCNSLINCSVGIAVDLAFGIVCIMRRAPIRLFGCGLRPGHGLHRPRRAIVENKLEQLGAGVVA